MGAWKGLLYAFYAFGGIEVMGFMAMELPILVYVLNGVMIVAGFSILVASLYAVSTILVTLAEDKDAPS
jgi:L-asparagine transporter-like permease